MSKINQTELNAIAVPLRVEQRRNVADVVQLMAFVDHLEALFVSSRDKAEKLMEAIVSEITMPK